MIRPFNWPDSCTCAVSLTYDDGLAVHREYAAPALDQRGLQATFYALITGDLLNNFDEWRKLAEQGHELGNHTLFHPCRRDHAAMHPWLDDGFDLRTYTPYRFLQELRVANLFLQLLDGKNVRSYGATCCDMYIGAGPTRHSIEQMLRTEPTFIAARGPQTDRSTPISTSLNLMNIGHAGADGHTFEHLRSQIETTQRDGAWLVFHIHGVGPETNERFISRDVHEKLLDFLASKSTVWVQPFIRVASYVSSWLQ
jgi:peptidoglycan-N-acetylglucosamine deacetylase